MATELQKLLEIGETLGYSGVELRLFVKEEQDKERDRRVEEREAEQKG